MTRRTIGAASRGCALAWWSAAPAPGLPGDEPGVPGVPHPRGGPEPVAGRGASLSSAGRARLVADGGGLENRYGVKPIVGSNPTPSAPTSGFVFVRPGVELRG